MTVIGLPELPRDSLILGSIIAEGSGGVQVFDAQLRDPVTLHEINVAVKQFPASSSEEQDVVFREMAVHAAVARSTSNVCLPHGWCFDGEGSLWLVMRKYARSLADRMREEPLSAEDLERYSKTLCKTMEDLERNNILHRDLKPANLLLDDDGDVVLADFGTALALGSEETHQTADELHGTFNYMSPESFDPEAFGHMTSKSDVWSFACCILEMMTGELPWTGTSMAAICYKITQTQDLPASIPSSLAPHVQRALRECLFRESERRPTFAQLSVALAPAWECGERAATAEDAASLECTVQHTQQGKPGAEQHGRGSEGGEGEGEAAALREQLHRNAEVTGMLRTQLERLLQGVKEQQRASGPEPRGDRDSGARRLEVAKHMLQQESARARVLAAEVQRLEGLLCRVGQSLLLVTRQAGFAAPGSPGGDGSWRPSLARLQALADLVAAEGRAEAPEGGALCSDSGSKGSDNGSKSGDRDGEASQASTPALRASVDAPPPLGWSA